MSPKIFSELKLSEKENRKQVLLQIAEDILNKKSIEDVTIRNVAAEAGLSFSAIYKYFTSKDEMLLALLAKNTRKLQMDIEAIEEKDDPAKMLKEIAVAYRTYFVSFGKYVDIIRHSADKTGQDVVNLKHMNELLEAIRDIFKVVDELAAHKKLKKYSGKIPRERFVPLLWSIVHGAAQVTLSSRSKAFVYDYDDVIDDFIYILLGKSKRIRERNK